MKRFCSMLALALALPFAALPTAFAGSSVCSTVAGNLIVNCGFETGDFTGWNNYASNYTAVDRSNPYSGNYAADLGSENLTILAQTVTDVNGAYYSLSFEPENEIATDATGTPYTGSNTFDVDYTNASGNSFSLGAFTNITESSAFTSYTFNFYGSGSDTIVFIYDNIPSYFELDDVVFKDPPAPGSDAAPSPSLSDSVSATPEPSGLALLGTGALALAGLARRKSLTGKEFSQV